MKRHEARGLIESNAEKIITVRFIKRTDGKLRTMRCIYYPKAANKATFRFNPVAKGLITVWDVEKGAPRFINLDGVQEISAGGERLEPASERSDLPQTLTEANREMEYLFG